MAAIRVVQGDIAKQEADAIVNAANVGLFGGSGVSGAIFDTAGYDDMTEACKKIGSCDYGDAVVTPAFKLHAKYVIHTVGPIYGQHNSHEPDILASCYIESLRRADELKLKAIVFPLISTGIYSYPKEEAAKIAIQSARDFLEDEPGTTLEEIVFCTFTPQDKKLMDELLLW